MAVSEPQDRPIEGNCSDANVLSMTSTGSVSESLTLPSGERTGDAKSRFAFQRKKGSGAERDRDGGISLPMAWDALGVDDKIDHHLMKLPGIAQHRLYRLG
jgi:hypothetical protein